MADQFEFIFDSGKLETAFWEFHYSHPEVYDLLLERAMRLKMLGHSHSTIQLVYEGIRGRLPLEKDNCEVHLNNNHTAFYARLLMEREPELRGFFRLRKQRIQSTFGPDNSFLPPGEHRH